jgi:hypothetical protein
MQRELLAKPKFLVPLMLLLWLAVSLPLSVSQAGPVNDPACGVASWDAGVWGQGDRPAHLSVQNPCYQATGTMVWGEWWRDQQGDCATGGSISDAYATCSDSDKNWYLRLNPTERNAAGVTSGEIKKLQRWGQCKAGQKDSSQWCNFLTETIPAEGNYHDNDPTNDTPQLPDPCLDKDWGGAPIVNTCKGKNIQIQFTGALAKDNNHGWKEVHPIRREIWTDSTGTHNCSLADSQNCPSS